MPEWCDVLGMRGIPALRNPEEAIETAFSHPEGSPTLEDIIRTSGGLERAHFRAAERVAGSAAVRIDREYDVVLTHGGRVTVNHYQAAKAAYEAIPAVKRGDTLILVAHNDDPEPVGKPEYRKVMELLKKSGPGEYSRLIRGGGWTFIPDQWQA